MNSRHRGAGARATSDSEWIPGPAADRVNIRHVLDEDPHIGAGTYRLIHVRCTRTCMHAPRRRIMLWLAPSLSVQNCKFCSGRRQ